MAPEELIKCQCCFRVIKVSDSRNTTSNTRKIFRSFVGLQLADGVICKSCNINLLTFDAFRKEILINHKEEHINSAQKILAVRLDQEQHPVESNKHPAAKDPETIKIQQEEQDLEFIICEVDPGTGPTNEDSDDDDVIVLPQEEQVTIDLDEIPEIPEIPDEPEVKKSKTEEMAKMYKCDHCSVVSSIWNVMVAHIKHAHTHPCSECDRVCPTADQLKRHQLRNHSQVGNYRKQSLQPTNLKLDDRLQFRLQAKPFGRRSKKARNCK